MASLVLTASARDARLVAARTYQPIVLNTGISPFEHFIHEHKQKDQYGDVERPSKRRRIDTAGEMGDGGSSAQSWIPIASMTITFASNLGTTSAGARKLEDGSDCTEAAVVEVEPWSDSGPIRLTLASPKYGKKGSLLVFQLFGDIGKNAHDVLSRVADLGRRGIRDRNVRGVAVSECHLSRFYDEEGISYALECHILWADGASALGPFAIKHHDEALLTRFYPSPKDEVQWTWSPQDFYDYVYVPPVDLPLPESLTKKVLETELYPFQKRAVAWMLDREERADETSRLSYSETLDAQGGACFISHLQSTLSSRLYPGLAAEPRGGILAEEMGLGKTCELISLICLRQRTPVPGLDPASLGDLNNDGLISSRATLIVTPATILQQWEDEIRKHAPHLSVMHYQGIPPASKKKLDQRKTLHDFATKDIVLTTYAVLAKEVHFAVDPPDRSLRRKEAKYERVRSPLVQMSWWRVCLDEAQMVESGVSAAARVAALLPRENAWAVSGTPLRKDVEDLFGLLVFLKYEPFDSSIIWKRLITSRPEIFHKVFNRIALRHTKDKIRNELRLPPQRRVVLTMPFTAVEDQNYRTLFAEMCEDVGCGTDGAPLNDQWDPQAPNTVENMRTWLARLRQTCLHPQVGGRNRRALGRSNGPLRTVAEVLEVMIEQNENAIRAESRLKILALLSRAHIIANAKDDERRAEKALEVYKTALEQAEESVSECRSHLMSLGNVDDAATLAEEATDEEAEKSPEHAARLRSRAALNNALMVKHTCAFFVGTSYFQIKSNETLTKPDSDVFQSLESQEMSYYDLAKSIRRELLRESFKKAENLMARVAALQKNALRPTKLSDIESGGGIENVRILSKADDLAQLLDRQSEKINKWESKVIELLLKPLVDEDEGLETTGDEYEDSTKQQDTLYAYMDALRAMVADRNTCITGQSAPLIDHEMNVLGREAREGNGHDPELMLRLLAERSKLKQKPDDLISLRGLTHEARALETSLQWQEGSTRAGAETAILQRQMRALGQITVEESKILAELEKGLELFRTTMNQRLEFYRQLQFISDTVAPYKEELDDTLDVEALERATYLHESRTKALAQLKTKRRFLEHLRTESSDSSAAERMCVICQCPFEQGVLTICGHQYCKECIQHWWKAHRTCPVCKRRLNMTDFHDVTYKPQELQAQEETHSTPDSSSPDRSEALSSRASSLYSDIGRGTLGQIKSMELKGSYGTKIDTLARHILWLREHDAGAKSIVFSQYREFLDVLSTAFKQFGIGFSRMGQLKAIDKFKQDAGTEAFLLDAKTDSSGLNLTNAQYVFLVEPLINTAIELQAIARVHRIGQQRATTVYMYLIGDTVEESIYDISVTRRLAHMQRSKKEQSRSATPMLGEAAIDAANSLELQHAPLSKLLTKGKGGGEMVAQDDLWSCLFGKARGREGNVSNELQTEVDRHLRAEAAEQRGGE